MNLQALAIFRRDMIGEQTYGPWKPESDTRDSFTETREELADGLNYLDVYEHQHCQDERDHEAVDYIRSLLKEADSRLCLHHTKSQERKHAEA